MPSAPNLASTPTETTGTGYFTKSAVSTVFSVGVNDKFGGVGKMPYLSEVYHMNVGDIVERCKQVIALKK